MSFPQETGEVRAETDVRVPLGAGGATYVVSRLIGEVTAYRRGGPWRVSTPDGRDLGEFHSRPQAAQALIDATGDGAAALPADVHRIEERARAERERSERERASYEQAVARAHAEYDRGRDGLPDLPLPQPPEQYGLWPQDFAAQVNAYAAAHGITLTETFRRISDVTGNSPSGLSLRYYKGAT